VKNQYEESKSTGKTYPSKRDVKRGTLCKVFDQWVIKDGDDLNHICIIDPPKQRRMKN
jgi:hypothetical protein